MQREKAIFWNEKEANLKMAGNFQILTRIMKPLIVYYLLTENVKGFINTNMSMKLILDIRLISDFR